MIEPLGHSVIIKVDKIKTETEWGFQVVTEGEQKKMEQAGHIIGTVVAIGPQAWKAFSVDFTGEPWAEVGDRVIFARYAGKTITDPADNEDYLLLNDEDIRARIKG